ncbi:hypothetical protein BT63DRAFT_429340 [Microthyrium microscopicum]|uniref:Copper transport protein n=1 Tax=Microthyrium microscopicum TaxID=703497 RepID=A0A6A6TYS8_9PEZI|nr:hypothetical protein BT63DRAFT_429340 [Microthyrium microscopicum]
MDMPMPMTATSGAISGTMSRVISIATPSSTPASNSSPMMGMMGMSNTFSTSTKVTLFVTDWTTDTPEKYFGTLVALFVITLLNRFLGAWRSQLGRVWADKAAIARQEQLHRRRAKRRAKRAKQRHFRREDKPKLDITTDSCHSSRSEEWQAESEPLSPRDIEKIEEYDSDSGMSDAELAMEKHVVVPLAPAWMSVFGGRWRAGNPWRFSIDVPRACLEGLRGFIGYLLMLAVMTFNVGFLGAVLFGIVVGELILGRFISGTGWEEGGCHD